MNFKTLIIIILKFLRFFFTQWHIFYNEEI